MAYLRAINNKINLKNGGLNTYMVFMLCSEQLTPGY